MATSAQTTFVTPEEYLQLENDRADDGQRCEYNNGDVYAMAGASRTHNLLTMKLANSLFNHLSGSDCQVFQSDMKVTIEGLKDTRFYYPDVQVSCEEEPDDYFNRTPCLIIEVLSVSTAKKDRAGLFAFPEHYVEEFLLSYNPRLPSGKNQWIKDKQGQRIKSAITQCNQR